MGPTLSGSQERKVRCWQMPRASGESFPAGRCLTETRPCSLLLLCFSHGSWAVLALCSLGLGLLGVWVEGGPAPQCGPTERRGKEAMFTHLLREAPWWEMNNGLLAQLPGSFAGPAGLAQPSPQGSGWTTFLLALAPPANTVMDLTEVSLSHLLAEDGVLAWDRTEAGDQPGSASRSTGAL